MNKKGFISISIVYSFFLVFLLLLLFVVSNLVYNRNLLSKVKAEVKNDINNATFSDYLINLYNQAKDSPAELETLNMVYYPYSNKDSNQLFDNSYRFVGNNPNNYVCFGTDASNCDINHLFRIIGIFDKKIKLIKHKSTDITGVSINKPIHINKAEFSTNYDFAATDLLNQYLNSTELGTGIDNEILYTFLTPNLTDANLETYQKYTELIEEFTWKYNKISYDASQTPFEIYNNEIINSTESTKTFVKKISLPYISDYLYAAKGTTNWMKDNYWFLTNNAANQFNHFYLNTNTIGNQEITNTYYVKPVFFLKQGVKKIDGDGTYGNPYRLGV